MQPTFITIENTPFHQQVIQRLPTQWENWPTDKGSRNDHTNNLPLVTKALHKKECQWPKKPVVFISDPHADAEAFEMSLVAAGVIEKTSEQLGDFSLTAYGKSVEVIIGGDCLDKGPSNLDLLRSIKALYKVKAKITLLAGNHDLRLRMGLLSMKRKKDAGNQHLFVRMGKKIVPLFKEVFEQYLEGTDWGKKIPDEDTCRRKLFPDEHWFNEFPFHAAGFLTAEGIDREVKKMHSKVEKFERHCLDAGLSLRHVYAAALHCQKLFLSKKGEFSWFFRKMELVTKRGSFLFLHAGLDDIMSQMLLKNGTKYVNKAFHKNLKRRDLFGFYYSSIANTFRTKYRDADLPLTEKGVKAIHKSGVKAVVQGHVNRVQGQRLALKKGLIHIEADITLDRNSRQLEGLEGTGVGATLINKEQGIVGISCDYPSIKVLDPEQFTLLYAA
ncbi:metallophosphoesterase [Rhodanobacter aciditrophus]|uniref:Metallophosphoesterase n=1 Tax=Rhodanobacter aciditrophus TaxID=1623218 RepID=A0ABW4B504_9GAMM